MEKRESLKILFFLRALRVLRGDDRFSKLCELGVSVVKGIELAKPREKKDETQLFV